MPTDEEFTKQILATFKMELDEKLQAITDGLLQLEKSQLDENYFDSCLNEIFRAAHNIKGSARGIGVNTVGEIAHHLESLFSSLQAKKITISSNIINLCLETVDAIREALQCHLEKKYLPYDLPSLLTRLQQSISPVAPGDTPETTEITNRDEAKNEEIITSSTATTIGEQKSVNTTTTPLKYESIRVNIRSIDKISAAMEELQLIKIALNHDHFQTNQLSKALNQFIINHRQSNLNSIEHTDQLLTINNMAHEINTKMNNHLNELDSLFGTLQDEIRMLRLVPVVSLLNSLPRIVRDLALKLNKKIEISIKDNDTKIDKMVLDGIKDPIIHILRNAIDHGIEDQKQRQAYSKPETGHIHVDVHQEGNQILFTISDDGCGMSTDHIAKTALKKGLISEAELAMLSKEQIIALIFLPGFSSKEIATEISGRGVGLDVVKWNLTALKGEVSVHTEPHQGSRFYLRVPLTLATERGLVIQDKGQLFALATNAVERVLLRSKANIITTEGTPALLLNDRPIPLQILSELFGNDVAPSSSQQHIVIINNLEHSVALLVDEVINEREIVIKALQDPIKNIPFIAGATISGRGEIIIVLKVHDLINKAINDTHKSFIPQQLETPTIVEDQPRLLLVDDSLTIRTFVKNILISRGYDVSVAVDGKEAWDILQNEKFSLLITDVNMPKMDGFELTAHVKKSQNLKDLPVIIVTSLDKDEDKRRGIEVGADAYVVKNEFESGELLEVIKQLI